MSSTASPNREIGTDGKLYRHSRREEWGVAILAWKEPGRRAYQFDDGKLRIVKEEYCNLLVQVEDGEHDTEEVVADLRETASIRKSNRGRVLAPVYSFEDQLTIFARIYPGGFVDESWLRDHRGIGASTAAKRHRNPSIEAAQTRLSKERLGGLIEEGNHVDAFGAIVAVLATTDLVAAKEVRALKELEDDAKTTITNATFDLLHGERPLGDRFRDFVRTVAAHTPEKPTWGLATALPALLFPEEHVCVRHSSFIRQAGAISPKAFFSQRPRRRAYTSFHRVAHVVREQLIAAGHEPRDLLDVHDFIWETLRPAAAKILQAE